VAPTSGERAARKVARPIEVYKIQMAKLVFNRTKEKHMTSKVKALEEYLRSAQPHLICRVEAKGDSCFELTPNISEVGGGWEKVTDEGYDPYGSPLGPVYWRVVNRAEERFHCSTFLATRAQVIKAFGAQGLAYCDPSTGMAVMRIETKLRR
jgi:hypothetical protein